MIFNCLDHGTSTEGRYVVTEYLRIELPMTIPGYTLILPVITIFFPILPYFLGIKISINKYIILVLINATIK